MSNYYEGTLKFKVKDEIPSFIRNDIDLLSMKLEVDNFKYGFSEKFSDQFKEIIMKHPGWYKPTLNKYIGYITDGEDYIYYVDASRADGYENDDLLSPIYSKQNRSGDVFYDFNFCMKDYFYEDDDNEIVDLGSLYFNYLKDYIEPVLEYGKSGGYIGSIRNEELTYNYSFLLHPESALYDPNEKKLSYTEKELIRSLNHNGISFLKIDNKNNVFWYKEDNQGSDHGKLPDGFINSLGLKKNKFLSLNDFFI